MTGPEGKSFQIPKLLVWEAWRRVKANKGAPGVDGQDLEAFESGLEGNLYKIWNRMSSGTWFPPPVRAVEVPKPHGEGVRVLGVPTVIAYHKVVQAAIGFAGRHTSLPSIARRASCGAVCSPDRCRSHLCVRGRSAGERVVARGCDGPWLRACRAAVEHRGFGRAGCVGRGAQRRSGGDAMTAAGRVEVFTFVGVQFPGSGAGFRVGRGARRRPGGRCGGRGGRRAASGVVGGR